MTHFMVYFLCWACSSAGWMLVSYLHISSSPGVASQQTSWYDQLRRCMTCFEILGSERSRDVPLLGVTFGLLCSAWARITRSRSFQEPIHVQHPEFLWWPVDLSCPLNLKILPTLLTAKIQWDWSTQRFDMNSSYYSYWKRSIVEKFTEK